MKKLILSFVVALCAIFSMSAGTNDQYNYVGHSRFFDNTSIGVYGGVQTNLHDWDAPNGAITSIVLGKEVTPTFGLSLELGTGWNNLANWTRTGHVHNGTIVDSAYAMLLGRTNLFNLFGGYKVRGFDMETVLGMGYGHSFGNVDGANFAMKAGMNFNWNFGKQKQFTFTVQPAVVWSLNAGMLDSRNGVAQVLGGLTYRFKTSNGTYHFNTPVLYDYDEVNALRAELANRPTNVEAEVEIKEVLVTNTVTEIVQVLPKVQFVQNNADISSTSTLAIYDIAQLMKQTDSKYLITGYASEEGSKEYNDELSLKRAENVKNALVNLGVSASRLDVKAGGPVTEFGPELMYNRTVTITEL